MNVNTKILTVIVGLVMAIAAAAAVWQSDRTKDNAAWERATISRDSEPSSQRPITGGDLFGSGSKEGGL
ncbi:hypothetical protein KEM63_01815 [Halopseudomonas nanhaiensis]|uniref:hypothetical protein n=1 Tax=Halopseudomonas nanhaiensis TaxID=2830842 RepID=UPI001CBF33D3|nr:hypothetical protein [Halopseudomonas nanhaiensis]UAW98748.1 hypothetical protein KEM63_01815 [Halopseudomonas nanhaiensis]